MIRQDWQQAAQLVRSAADHVNVNWCGERSHGAAWAVEAHLFSSSEAVAAGDLVEAAALLRRGLSIADEFIPDVLRASREELEACAEALDRELTTGRHNPTTPGGTP